MVLCYSAVADENDPANGMGSIKKLIKTKTTPSNTEKVFMFVLFCFKLCNRGKSRMLFDSDPCVLVVVD